MSVHHDQYTFGILATLDHAIIGPLQPMCVVFGNDVQCVLPKTRGTKPGQRPT